MSKTKICKNCSGEIEKRPRGHRIDWIHTKNNRFYCDQSAGFAEPICGKRLYDPDDGEKYHCVKVLGHEGDHSPWSGTSRQQC